MPTYVYKCTNNHTTDLILSLSEHVRVINCPECNTPARQIISPPRQVSVDNMPNYECPVTGEHVTSRKQRNEIMKRHDLVEMG